MNVRLILATLLLCSACVTGPDPEGEKRARAWGQIVSDTSAVRIGEDRLRIEASTPFVSNLSTLEYTALARAAGEALKADSPRFALLWVDFDGDPLGSLLVPEVGLAETTWIGTYEDLLEARELGDLTGTVNDRFGYRTVSMVALLLDDELADQPTFDAELIYDSMLAERIERKDIKPKRRLNLPFF